jgi:two-component system chemotaxis response regulator CheY
MFPKDTLILIIDDSETARKELQNELMALGFTKVTEARDGIDGLAKLEFAEKKEMPFELIIADWSMPGRNGLELLKKIRTMPVYASTPYILLTSVTDMNQVTAAVISGVSNYIVKPLNSKVLKEKLESVWAKISS